jgi:hypothetical protein
MDSGQAPTSTQSAPGAPEWGQPSFRHDDSWAGPQDVWIPSDDERRDGLPVGLRRATFQRRGVAYALDSALLMFVFWMFLLITSAGGFSEKSAIAAGLLGGGFQIVYFVAGWVNWRASPAQLLLGIQIGEAKSGASLGWGDAFVRWGILQGPFALVSILPFSVRLLGFACAAAWMTALVWVTRNDPEGRGPHDRAVSCLVVHQM